MVTRTANRAAATFPVFKPTGSGIMGASFGVFELTANPVAADIIQFCRVPAGAMVIGGYLRGDDLDTGVETLDIDVGWAANGVEVADPDGFGNFGIISGDVILEWKPEVSIFMPLNGLLKDGPVTFTNETIIQAVVNTAAATGGTGTIWLAVWYIVA